VTGTQTITVTAANTYGIVTGTYVITIRLPAQIFSNFFHSFSSLDSDVFGV
jgi:hypothetical protein